MLIPSTFHIASCDWYIMTYCKSYILCDGECHLWTLWTLFFQMTGCPQKTGQSRELTVTDAVFIKNAVWFWLKLFLLFTKNVTGQEWNPFKVQFLKCEQPRWTLCHNETWWLRQPVGENEIPSALKKCCMELSQVTLQVSTVCKVIHPMHYPNNDEFQALWIGMFPHTRL